MTTETFFTSDNHFFHKAILRLCENTRKGSDVTEMGELMIQKWNDTVGIADTVYMLGDFSFGDARETRKILERLHGRLHLIQGNHDYWIDDSTSVFFESIQQYKQITFDKHKIIMFHFPIYAWNSMAHGSIHLYGHVHGDTDIPGKAMDVGIDARPTADMGLWHWEDIKKYMAGQEVRSHHEKKIT